MRGKNIYTCTSVKVPGTVRVLGRARRVLVRPSTSTSTGVHDYSTQGCDSQGCDGCSSTTGSTFLGEHDEMFIMAASSSVGRERLEGFDR